MSKIENRNRNGFRFISASALLGATALLLSACGSDGGSSDGQSAQQQEVQEAIDSVVALRDTLQEVQGLREDTDFGSGSGSDKYDASTLLDNTADKVIVPIYSDLDSEASDLQTAVEDLRTAINGDHEQDILEAKLQDARNAWVATRDPWEKSEAFLYGPVDTQGFDPRLDSWPVNKTDLDGVLTDNDSITASTIDNLENTLRGFHTVEYLLWNDGNSTGQHSLADVVNALETEPNRLDYLAEVTKDVADTASDLRDAWDPNSGDGEYANTLASAGGDGNDTYRSQNAGVQEVIGGMVTIADEVGTGKLADPLKEEDPSIVESKFSFNSREDFMDDIRGIKAVYYGDYAGHDGEGITDFVESENSDLDDKVRSDIDDAIQQIKEIDQPFRDSIQ